MKDNRRVLIETTVTSPASLRPRHNELSAAECTPDNFMQWPEKLLKDYWASKEYNDAKKKIKEKEDGNNKAIDEILKDARKVYDEIEKARAELEKLEAQREKLDAKKYGIQKDTADYKLKLEKEAMENFLKNTTGYGTTTKADPDDWYNTNWDIDPKAKGTADYDNSEEANNARNAISKEEQDKLAAKYKERHANANMSKE